MNYRTYMIDYYTKNQETENSTESGKKFKNDKNY